MIEQIIIDKTVFPLPYADLLPPLTSDEYAALTQDIARRGIVVPIVLDEHNNVLDGQHRLRAAADLGLTAIPFEIRPGLSDTEKEQLALDLNIHRRHMSREQRQELVLKLRQKGQSTRQIAETIGVSHQTVANDIDNATVKNLTVEKPNRITGKDGKERPATMPRIRVDSTADVAKAQPLLSFAPETPRAVDLTDLQRSAKEHRREQAREQNRELVASAPIPQHIVYPGTYQTIAIDPPWDWGDEGDVDQMGRAKPTYKTMSFEEIIDLPVFDLASENAHIYLWITNRSLPKGFELLKAWDFRYITTLTWCKPSFGMGNYFRGSTEQILFGVRGSLPLLRNDKGTWFEAPRGERHSSKPDAFYELVEQCSPGPWLEMFARNARPGWTAWGAEAQQ